jgi:FUN14 family protein
MAIFRALIRRAVKRDIQGRVCCNIHWYDGRTRSLVKLLKKVIKIAPVIVGLFIAALAYSQYQGIIHMELVKFQKLLQQGITICIPSRRHPFTCPKGGWPPLNDQN